MEIPDSAAFEGIALRHGVRLLLQFGSTVSGRAHGASDVDLAALFEEEPTLDRQLALAGDLQEIFPGRTVDLGVLNHADPLFLKKALEDCRLLAGSPRRLAELRLYAFRRYQDHRRFFALEDRHVRRLTAGRPGA